MLNFSLAKARHLRMGRYGENAACRLLRRKGYVVLARNYKTPRGEVDIVARDGAILSFVEVKTRRWRPGRDRSVSPLSRWQARRIKRAAMEYLDELEHPKVFWRFDLIEICVSRFGVKELFHWKGNFGKREAGGGDRA
ncbi:MAG: YraN family protein [Ferruginibacter sp.]